MTAVNKISDFKVERYLLGELSEEEMAALQKREAEDEIFAARVRAMREENARILADNPFASLEDRVKDSARDCFAAGAARNDVGEGRSVSLPNRSFNAWWLKVAAALVIMVGISAIVSSNRNVATYERGNASMEVAMAETDNSTRIKGMQASLEVWKKTGDSAVQMVNLGEAREGDEIQLRYRVPQKCFGMLISMDGNGTITMHMGEGNKSVELEPGKMTTLPFAYKLDNAPKFEKFFLLTSQNSFEIDGNDIDKGLKQAGVENVSFTLRKVEK